MTSSTNPAVNVPAPIFEIVSDANDEEHIEVFCNGIHVRTLNHDDDGWGGMAAGQALIESIAKACGGTVLYRDSQE